MKNLSELKTKNYKILFSDLDGTLIKTKSGKTFPEDASDYEFKYKSKCYRRQYNKFCARYKLIY